MLILPACCGDGVRWQISGAPRSRRESPDTPDFQGLAALGSGSVAENQEGMTLVVPIWSPAQPPVLQAVNKERDPEELRVLKSWTRYNAGPVEMGLKEDIWGHL